MLVGQLHGESRANQERWLTRLAEWYGRWDVCRSREPRTREKAGGAPGNRTEGVSQCGKYSGGWLNAGLLAGGKHSQDVVDGNRTEQGQHVNGQTLTHSSLWRS